MLKTVVCRAGSGLLKQACRTGPVPWRSQSRYRWVSSLPMNTVILFVPQQEAWVVERMGRFHRILEPERESLNSNIVHSINQASDDWGIRCLRYEIKDIHVPPRVKESMQMQVEAERKKRATVLESEGTREAAINVAEGRKRAQILASEGEKAEQINKAAAASLSVAEQYVTAFSNLAKQSNTVILPSNTGDVSSMVTQAMAIYGTLAKTQSSSSVELKPEPADDELDFKAMLEATTPESTSVIKRLQNDTLLVVMGDHGMTDTGDHGGESQKETDAALFLYSGSPLFQASDKQVEPEVVPQIDLVPTLALLLGIPIPFSSVGQIILPLFPRNSSLDAPAALSQAEALWINVKQVHRFLETYSSMAKDIPADSLSQLRARFSQISDQYMSSIRDETPLNPELVASMQEYLSSVRETCRASWARFNPLKMAAGLLVLSFGCILCYIISELSVVVLQAAMLKTPVLAGLMCGGAVSVIQIFTLGYVEVSWSLGAAVFCSEALFLWKARKVCPRGRLSYCHLLTLPLLVLLLRCASLLSDSYVIFEGRVVTFLLFSLGLYIPLKLNWDGVLMPAPSTDSQKPAGLIAPSLPPSVVRRESGTLLVCISVLMACLYLSLSFHSCREEQGACQPSVFLTPLSRVQDSRLRNLHYVLSLASLSAWAYLLHRWLRHYGNLNCTGVVVFTARGLLPLAAICIGLHWAVSATPEDTFKNLAELIRLAQVILPRIAFGLLGFGMLLLWLDPLTVFLKTRATLNSRGTGMPPPRYRASTGISPQAELNYLIPQLYQRIRHSLDDEGAKEIDPDGRPAVEAYGLGTVYSAPLVLLCGLMGLGMLLLHSEGMALAFLLLLLQAAALLYLHASSSNLSSQQSHSGVFSVPWTSVVLWSLAASQFFHATGHQPTFPSIQWGAAFVGFPQGHTGTALPATLVTLNTFSSHILFAVSCPLLLFWPLVCELRGTRTSRLGGAEDGDEVVMEMRLRENPQQFSSALLQLATRYLFVNGTQASVLASVCAAAILRRHLMVWKVFAPKLMFEASAFIVGSVFVLVGVALVTRVDVAVARLFQRLLPENSR
ncbi:GPI ethanolamine phosphate transferase 3 [Bagarius yarrelli]|uniref:GPI ethanolamine phosphate transferase 3 n=1 Tax=Bagarius yarrelli TaxID=175774 RepID=A0A556U2M5_BAGYA|nr:GPI ethanolamine phosphate transferase 3 [Bagarius yarrelli]